MVGKFLLAALCVAAVAFPAVNASGMLSINVNCSALLDLAVHVGGDDGPCLFVSADAQAQACGVSIGIQLFEIEILAAIDLSLVAQVVGILTCTLIVAVNLILGLVLAVLGELLDSVLGIVLDVLSPVLGLVNSLG